MNTAVAYSAETTAMAAHAAIARGDVSVEELASRFLTRIEVGNGSVGAVRHVLSEQAMGAARALDRRLQSGEALPVLAGLPVLIKENCDTVGAPCSAGLSFRQDRIPASDSAVCSRLRAAGAIILGVSVCDPGAFDVRTPQVLHLADPTLTVGGSSGGSAAALAAGFCLGAIGTDTGGSIRIPSACCGTVGLKPTYGAVSMEGIFPLVPSLDHVGPMARSVADVELLWRAFAGRPSIPGPGLRQVGYDPAWIEIADPSVRAAFALGLEKLHDLGVPAVEIRLPNLDDVVAMHGEIVLPEAAAYHLAHHGEDLQAYPAIAREWFDIAREMTVGTYVEACSKRVAMTRKVNDLLRQVDAIVTPTIAVSRPPKSADTLRIGGVLQDFTMGLVRLTCLFNHTGHPAIAFPMPGVSDRLSSSLQIVGPHGGEQTILEIAGLLEHGNAFIV